LYYSCYVFLLPTTIILAPLQTNGITVSMGFMNASHFWGFFFEAMYFTNDCNTSHCILLHSCDKIPVKWVMAKAIILCEGDSSIHPRFFCMASATHIKKCVRNPGYCASGI